ncbi:MAG: polymer-forming cytoskeletal protein [Candidatus Zixiibacteriota bacterium]
MEQDLTQPGAAQQPKKKKMNGCLLAFLIFLGLLIIGGGIAGYFIYKGFSSVKNKFVEEFAEDYESHSGQAMTIGEQSGDHLYFAQTVTIEGKNDGNLAFLVQNAKIEADVTGDIAATSQTLTVEQGVRVDGNIHFIGQSLFIKGYVGGKISGSAQVINIREDLIPNVDLEYQSLNKIPAPKNLEQEPQDSTAVADSIENLEDADIADTEMTQDSEGEAE